MRRKVRFSRVCTGKSICVYWNHFKENKRLWYKEKWKRLLCQIYVPENHKGWVSYCVPCLSWWILPASWKVRQLSASSQHCRLFSLLPTIIFFPTLTTFDSGFLGHGICPGCYYFNNWVPWYCICIKPKDHIYGEVLELGCLRHLRVWSTNPVFSL